MKIPVLSILFGCITSFAVLAQSPAGKCDTLRALDGRELLVNIISEAPDGIVYAPCSGDNCEKQFFMSREKIASVSRYKQPKEHIGMDWAKKSKTLFQSYVVSLWAGLALPVVHLEPKRLSLLEELRFGLEARPKHGNVGVTFWWKPNFTSSRGIGATYTVEKKGVSGDWGLSFKHRGIGPLSGKISRGMFGVDLGYGRLWEDRKHTWYTQEVRSHWYYLGAMAGWQLDLGKVAIHVGNTVGGQLRKGLGEYGNQGSAIRFFFQPFVGLGVHL